MPSNVLNTTSLYEQLYILLRDRILSDEYQPGDKFLAERAICQQYGVSRSTSNKAISNLISAGYLEFRKGVGTFVRSKQTLNDYFTMTSLTASAKAQGISFRSRFRSIEQRTGKDLSRHLKRVLAVEDDDTILVLDSLRYVHHDIPFLHELRYIVCKHCPGLTIDNYNDFFTNDFSIDITFYEERFLHGVLDEKESSILERPIGTPYSIIESIGYIKDHIPLWWGITHHRPDEDLYSVCFSVDCFSENNNNNVYFDFKPVPMLSHQR
ncbi:GntR family transcriptional regulator [Faecalicatena contorta]|uniref:GntR family transcriptional regulator n=1 Tax=Faecalicatena contorta TaxID=39482 RepID=UPI0031D0CC46